MGRGRSDLSSDGPVIAAPKQVNAVNLLIEHRQELTLTDSQFAHVVVIKRALDSTDMPLLRKIDSVATPFQIGAAVLEPEPGAARLDRRGEGVRQTDGGGAAGQSLGRSRQGVWTSLVAAV